MFIDVSEESAVVIIRVDKIKQSFLIVVSRENEDLITFSFHDFVSSMMIYLGSFRGNLWSLQSVFSEELFH
jgi:hypothetical protein